MGFNLSSILGMVKDMGVNYFMAKIPNASSLYRNFKSDKKILLDSLLETLKSSMKNKDRMSIISQILEETNLNFEGNLAKKNAMEEALKRREEEAKKSQEEKQARESKEDTVKDKEEEVVSKEESIPEEEIIPETAKIIEFNANAVEGTNNSMNNAKIMTPLNNKIIK